MYLSEGYERNPWTKAEFEECSRRTDVLPIKRDAGEPKTFVSVSPTEKVGNDILCRAGNVLRGKADDVDAVQEGEDVRGEDLPNEHPGERRPEDQKTLVVRRAVEVEGYLQRNECFWVAISTKFTRRLTLELEDGHRWQVLEAVSTIRHFGLQDIKLTPQYTISLGYTVSGRSKPTSPYPKVAVENVARTAVTALTLVS